MDSAGDFLVAWQNDTQDGSLYGIFAQRYLVPHAGPSTVVAGSEFQVNTYTTGNQASPKVASDAAGDYVVVWESYAEDGDGKLRHLRPALQHQRRGPRERVSGQHVYDRQSKKPSGGHGFGRRLRRRLDELW